MASIAATELRDNKMAAFELGFGQQIDLDAFKQTVEQERGSMRLWLLETESQHDFRRFRGVDLHTWDRMLLDVGTDFAYLTVPGKGCVNAVPRLAALQGIDNAGKTSILFDGEEYSLEATIMSRLKLYQRAIQLFHHYKRTRQRKEFRGPFYQVGLRNYKLSPLFFDHEGKDFKPDIVASRTNMWIAFELTTSLNSKEPKLAKYQRLDPSYLSNYGLTLVNNPPDVLCGRSNESNDGSFCQLILLDNLGAKGLEHLTSDELRNAIIAAIGTNLDALPDLPFTLIPGEMKRAEIRVALVDQLIQMFDAEALPKFQWTL